MQAAWRGQLHAAFSADQLAAALLRTGRHLAEKERHASKLQVQCAHRTSAAASPAADGSQRCCGARAVGQSDVDGLRGAINQEHLPMLEQVTS